jgi:DNA-binding CsgD family transcriptional regulator
MNNVETLAVVRSFETAIQSKTLWEVSPTIAPFDDDPTITLRGATVTAETPEHCVVVVHLPQQEQAKRQVRGLIAQLVRETSGSAFSVQPGAPSSPEALTGTDEAGWTPDNCAAATLALSQRELDVLDGLSRGEPAKRVAQGLGISVHTCRGYIKSLHQKLNARNQVEVVINARAFGLCRETWPDD